MPEVSNAQRRVAGTDIVLAEQTARTCINLRGAGSDPRFARAVESVTDLRPPLVSGTSVSGLFASVLWLGPDEWLVVSETQGAADLAARLREALSGQHCAVTDVGAGCIVYALNGHHATDVLAKGCPIDLHSRAFAPGRCARSLLARMPVLIHLRAADPLYELYVGRSFRDYAWSWLVSAAGEYLQP